MFFLFTSVLVQAWLRFWGAVADDDDSMEILGSTPAKKMRATANNTPFPVIDSPAAPAALLTGRARVKIKRQSATGSKKNAQTGAARQRPPKLCRANSESTESEDDPGDELSTESEHQRPVRNVSISCRPCQPNAGDT